MYDDLINSPLYLAIDSPVGDDERVIGKVFGATSEKDHTLWIGILASTDDSEYGTFANYQLRQCDQLTWFSALEGHCPAAALYEAAEVVRLGVNITRGGYVISRTATEKVAQFIEQVTDGELETIAAA